MQYLVHIGYPKSASTWLQKKVFSGGSYGFTPISNLGTNHKFGPTSFFDGAGVQAEIEARTDPSADISVLSNEAWAGMHGPGLTEAYAERIVKHVPEAKVLIVVRAQPDMLMSAYLHWLVKRMDDRPLMPFLAEFAPRVDYARVVRLYDRLFGSDRVIVMPFEPIRHSATKFVKPMFNAYGIAVPDALDGAAENQRNNAQAMVFAAAPWLRRAIGSRLSRRVASSVGTRLGTDWALKQRAALMDRIARETSGTFREGNRYLAARIGADLGAMGYPI